MSIYSFHYCRLLRRMTHCWLALLMQIFHLHPYGTKQLNQVLWLRPLCSCIYVYITTKINKLNQGVCESEFILRGNISSDRLLSKLYLKNKRGIKPLNLSLLSFFPVHPSVKKQPKYFVSAPRLQLLLVLAPQSPLCLWPHWPVPTIAPVGIRIHCSVLGIEKPDSLTWRFGTLIILL